MQEEQKEKIKVDLTHAEHEFIKFCRRVGYAQFICVVMKGEPIKALNPIESRRFDLSPTKNLTND